MSKIADGLDVTPDKTKVKAVSYGYQFAGLLLMFVAVRQDNAVHPAVLPCFVTA
ncbi:MAG: hypothetical protein AB7G75_20130 [Candidatus Binatia bacterium]